MSMNTPIGNITQTTPIKDFKELDEMQNEQYLLGIDDNAVGNGSKISLENLINSSISTDNDNLITKGTDDRLLVNTPVEIGDLSNLTTTNKSTLVAAINEVDGDIATEVTNRVNAVSGEATTRANADNNLQSQIDAITAASDVTDIVGTYAELQAYDTTGLPDNSIIKVLQDESRQNETTYYRWVITGSVGAWVLIGEEGPYTTIAYVDGNFATKATVGNLSNLATSDKSSIVNAMNELASVLDPTQTADYIKNSKAIYSGEVSENALILPQIKEMAHSTFDRSKFTVVGSPNITDNGIASGFSSSNYIKSFVNIPIGSKWKISFPLNTGNERADSSQIPLMVADKNSSSAKIKVELNATGYLYFQFYHLENGAVTYFAGWNTPSPIPLNTKDVYEIEFTGSSYNIYKNKNLIKVLDVNIAIDSNELLFTPYTNTYGTYGCKYPQDLKQFSVTVDGVEVFSGNKTGIDTIKPDNYTVVGMPTISADGVASGFAVNDKIDTGFKFKPNGKPWKSYVEFTTGSNILTSQGVIGTYGTGDSSSIYLTLDGGSFCLKVYLSSNGTSWDIFNSVIYRSIKAHTTYMLSTEWTGTQYIWKLLVNNDWITLYTLDSTTPIYDLDENIYIGVNRGTSNPFFGQINLNSIKYYIAGDLVYQPCLKIPYTKSKTGSKVVNAIYRDRVNDMSAQFGYANYYTLQNEANSNYTVVGNPTISSDFVASGFSNSNYLVLSFSPSNLPWVIYAKFLYNQISGSSSTPKIIGGDSSSHRNMTLGIDSSGKLVWWAGTGGNSWDIFNSLTGAYSFIDDEEYYIKLSFDGTKYKAEYSTDGVTYTTDIEFSSSVAIGSNYTLRIGLGENNTSPWDGSIDLKQFKIYVDNKLAYKAVIEPNFTLPQVELYGYIEKRARDIAHPVAQPFYRFSDEINEDEVRLEGAEVDKGLYLAIENDPYLSALCTAGSTSGKICLPDFRNRVIYGDVASGYIEPELPNITGSVEGPSGKTALGAFTVVPLVGLAGGNSSSIREGGLYFDASLSSTIYKDGGTVKTAGVKTRWLCRWK